MLLIFFLVTSSMDTDKGLPRQLPPPQQEQQKEVELKVKERNVMEIRIDADNQLTCNGEPTTPEALKERIEGLHSVRVYETAESCAEYTG